MSQIDTACGLGSTSVAGANEELSALCWAILHL